MTVKIRNCPAAVSSLKPKPIFKSLLKNGKTGRGEQVRRPAFININSKAFGRKSYETMKNKSTISPRNRRKGIFLPVPLKQTTTRFSPLLLLVIQSPSCSKNNNFKIEVEATGYSTRLLKDSLIEYSRLGTKGRDGLSLDFEGLTSQGRHSISATT